MACRDYSEWWARLPRIAKAGLRVGVEARQDGYSSRHPGYAGGDDGRGDVLVGTLGRVPSSAERGLYRRAYRVGVDLGANPNLWRTVTLD